MKILLAILFLLCVPLVAADISYNIANVSSCHSLSIELISSEQRVDANEYYFNGCSVNGSLWTCTCDDTDKQIILMTKPNTINKYEFEINSSSVERKETSRRSGGHFFYSGNFEIKNENNKTVIVVNNTNENKSNESKIHWDNLTYVEGKDYFVVNKTKDDTVIINKKSNAEYYIFAVLIVLMIAIGLTVWIKFYRKV